MDSTNLSAQVDEHHLPNLLPKFRSLFIMSIFCVQRASKARACERESAERHGVLAVRFRSSVRQKRVCLSLSRSGLDWTLSLIRVEICAGRGVRVIPVSRQQSAAACTFPSPLPSFREPYSQPSVRGTQTIFLIHMLARFSFFSKVYYLTASLI